MSPLLGNRRCHGNHFVFHSLGVFLMLASKYELNTTTQYWVITIFNWIRYVTLWPWPLTFWHWSHDATWVVNPCTSLNMIRLTVSELGRLQFSIDRQLKVPIFTFLGVKGSNFKFNLSNPQKALPWRERRIMTYWALGCVQKCDLWAWLRKEKKDRNIHASNWLFAQTTNVDVGPWNFACGVVSGKSSYISSFMKIGPGVSELWGAGVENRPLPLTRPVDYTTACM